MCQPRTVMGDPTSNHQSRATAPWITKNNKGRQQEGLGITVMRRRCPSHLCHHSLSMSEQDMTVRRIHSDGKTGKTGYWMRRTSRHRRCRRRRTRELCWRLSKSNSHEIEPDRRSKPEQGPDASSRSRRGRVCETQWAAIRTGWRECARRLNVGSTQQGRHPGDRAECRTGATPSDQGWTGT